MRLAKPVEAIEIDPRTGEPLAGMIDFRAGDEITVCGQATAGTTVLTVFWATRLPCGLHGTGPGGQDEHLGPFCYVTEDLDGGP